MAPRLLVEAMRTDIRVASSNMRNVSVANTAALIVLLIATAFVKGFGTAVPKWD